MTRLKNRPLATLGWLACTLLLLLAATPLARLERSLADAVVLRSSPPAADLVLVDIDEASLTALGAWPWPRPLLAELADRIAAAGARRQIWDLLLTEPRAGDDILASALDTHAVTVGAVPVIDPGVDAPPRSGRIVSPLPTVEANPSGASLCAAPVPASHGHLGLAESLLGPRTRTGHLAPRIDDDGRLRRLPPLVCDQGTPLPTLILAPRLVDRDHERPIEPRHLALNPGRWPWSAPWYLDTGRERIPLDAEGNIQLEFRTPLADYPTLPASHLLAGDLPADALRGKTVLLGASALGLGDRVATRLSPITPGLAVHAELHSRLEDGQFVHPLRQAWPLSVLFLALAGLPWLFRPAAARWGLPASALLTSLLALILINQGIRVALLPVLGWHLLFGLALFVARFVEEKQARRLHQRRLASIIPPALLEQLDPDAPQDIVAARRRRFGIVHGQLRNLPQFANRADPETVLAVFHALNRLAQQIASNHGAQLYPSDMDEFLLVWPEVRSADDPPRMLLAARELHRGISQLLAGLESATGLALEIAVHADDALDGFIGSRERRRPVLYGRLRQVTAAMLQLSTELASPILVSDAATPGHADEHALRDLGTFKLEDIRQPHALYACTQTLDPLPEHAA